MLLDPPLIGLLVEATVKGIEKMRLEFIKVLPNGLPVQDFLDAIPPADSAEIESLCGVKAKEVLTILLTGSDEQRRSLATSLLNNPHFLRQAFAAFSDDAVEQFNAQFPSSEFRWTRELLTTFLTGSPEERSQLWRRFFIGVMSFKQLITYYRSTVPELADVGTTFDDSSSRLVDQLRLMQQFEPLRAAILGTPARWDRDIGRSIGTRYLESIRDEIGTYVEEHGFPAETAERQLQAEGFKRLPYIRAITIWLRSYLAHHKGTEHRENRS